MAAEIPDSVVTEARGPGRAQLIADFEAALVDADVDAIAYPSVPVLPPLIREGGDQPEDTLLINGEEVSATFSVIRNTMIAPVLRAPAISLPMGLSAEGLPVGMDLCAPLGTDRNLLAIAQAVEPVLLV
jgi:mandelamide amidase